jgi:hypothetical protein
MKETLEIIMKEKTGADHLLYVSLKYTKTCDVTINLLKRWAIMLEYSFDGLLKRSKMKKKIKTIPTAPKIKIDLTKELFKDQKEVLDAIELYEMFKLIDLLKKSKENEFRKGVCLRVIYKGEEVAINLDKLKEYSEVLEKFINYTKLFLTSK